MLFETSDTNNAVPTSPNDVRTMSEGNPSLLACEASSSADSTRCDAASLLPLPTTLMNLDSVAAAVKCAREIDDRSGNAVWHASMEMESRCSATVVLACSSEISSAVSDARP